MLIQKLRLKKGWSQQQLADASGVSARTIQRIESGQAASAETLKSIAAVFEVDFASLNPELNMESASSTHLERQEQQAFAYVRKLRRFYMHLFKYCVVVLGLLVVNLIFTPRIMWVYWVMGGWGFGVLLHGLSVCTPERFLGADWERRQVEKRLGRSL